MYVYMFTKSRQLYVLLPAGAEIKTEPLNYCNPRAARMTRYDFDALYVYIYICICIC